MRRNEPQTKIDQESVQVKNDTTFSFFVIIIVCNLLIHATIDECPNSLILASSCLNFMF